MPRARNIKHGFFVNEDLIELPFDVRLLFIGLWTIADREGRLEDRPLKIKIEVFPADDVDVNRGLELLRVKGFISRYEVGGKRYIEVTNFVRHQRPHQNEAGSLIPSAVEALAPMVEALAPKEQALGSERGMMNDECGMMNDECAASPPDAEQTQDGFPEAAWGYPMDTLIASFPEIEFMPAQIGFIESEVKDTPLDREAWSYTIQLYRQNHDPMANRYLPTKTGNLLSVFREKRAKLQKEQNGATNKSYRQQRADEAQQSFERTAAIRERVEARDRQLQGTALPDSGRQLQLVEPDANGHGKGGAS